MFTSLRMIMHVIGNCARLLMLTLALLLLGCSRAGELEPAVDSWSLTGFPQHSEALLVNDGASYVYGELSVEDGCLRISYDDPNEGVDHGLLPVWPAALDVTMGEGRVEVLERDGVVVAGEGDLVRLSGRKFDRWAKETWSWRWFGTNGLVCPGPYWLVGDEVSAGDHLRVQPAQGPVYFPTLEDVRGSVSHPEALLEGRLLLEGRCFRIRNPPRFGKYLVIWPPGFRPVRVAEGWAVANGGGNIIAVVGERISVGGYAPEETDYLGAADCSGRYFYAYQILLDRGDG